MAGDGAGLGVGEGEGVGDADGVGVGDAVGDWVGDAEWGGVRLGVGELPECGDFLWCELLGGFEWWSGVEPDGWPSPALPGELTFGDGPPEPVPAVLLDATAGAPPPLP